MSGPACTLRTPETALEPNRRIPLMSLREHVCFFCEFLLKPRVVGALLPSSRNLALEMVNWIDWSNVRTVLEYGPGTGVMTEQVCSRIRPATRFLSIEVNPRLAGILRSRFPSVRVYQDSVRNVRGICQREGIDEVDVVVSGLPWASFSAKDQREFLHATLSVLKRGGQFATFAYLQGLLLPSGQRFKRELHRHFTQVELSKTTWMNLPPALVYRCRR